VPTPCDAAQAEAEEVSSLDSLEAILRVARSDGHPARLAYVQAAPAAAAARGHAASAPGLLRLMRELAACEDEAVRQTAAAQLAPLGAPHQR